MKIYILEPDINRQRQLRTILSSLGHRSADIESDADQKRALNALRKRRYDAAFACVKTAEGMADLLKTLRTGVSTKHLPVVAYASEVTKDLVLATIQAGATTILAYPFSVSDVENALRLCTPKQ